jgi:hypothetical protein
MEQNLLKINYFNLQNLIFESSNGFFTMGFFEKLYCKISLNLKIEAHFNSNNMRQVTFQKV